MSTVESSVQIISLSSDVVCNASSDDDKDEHIIVAGDSVIIATGFNGFKQENESALLCKECAIDYGFIND